MKFISFPLSLAFVIFAGILSSGCKDSSTSVGTSGNISGFVTVLDTFFHGMTDNSGVTVSLEGTAFKTVSDASGKWNLSNVAPGTYTLTFSKDNYATRKDQNFQFTGNGTFYYNLGYSTSMYPIPNLFPNIVLRPFQDYAQITFRTDTIIYLDSSHRFPTHIELYDTLIMPMDFAVFSSRSQYLYNQQSVYGIVFFAKTPNIDPGNASSFLLSINSNTNADTAGITNFGVHRSDLLRSGFSSGDNIYCSAYAFYSLISWIDPATNKKIYTSLSSHHSDVVSFIIP
jgi:hypothetical protein